MGFTLMQQQYQVVSFRLEVTVDVSDSNPILDYQDICSKTVSTLKPCYVRLAKMDMIPSSILKKLGLKTQCFKKFS